LGVSGIAVNVDLAVQAVVDGEAEDAGGALEELPDRLAAFVAAEAGAFPDRVRGELGGDGVGVVVVVAMGGVFGLQVADGFRVPPFRCGVMPALGLA